MPGPHKEVYATATLSICIFTTIVCGGFTDRMLSLFGMKEERTPIFAYSDDEEEHMTLNRLTYKPPPAPIRRQESHLLVEQRRRLREGIKGLWYRFDDRFLKPHFGGDGAPSSTPRKRSTDGLGNYELGSLVANGDDEEEDED